MLQTISDLIGAVEFLTVPDGADIYIDNVHQGVKTTCIIDNVPTGEHDYTLKLDGYISVSGLFNIQSSEQTNIKVDLLPEIGDFGYINISSTPEGGTVYIDDVIMDSVTPTVIKNVKPGNYMIKIVLDNYINYMEYINVKAGEITYLNILMDTVDKEKELDTSKLFKIALIGLFLVGATKVVSNKN